jgi:putative DNA primase/helicase
VIQERVINGINSNASNERNLSALSASEVLMKLGIRFPSNLQAKECAAILRELLGDSKRINGINKWRVSFNHNSYEE